MSQESLLSGFMTKSDTNLTEQPKKMARSLQFQIYKPKEFYYLDIGNSKWLISIYGSTADVHFCFLHVPKNRVSHDAYHEVAHMSHVMRKPVFRVPDQVQHKLGCAAEA